MTSTASGGVDRDPNCVFCKVISGSIPSRQIYQDDQAVAFLDIGAWQRGHSLVVPKRHVPDLISGQSSLSDIAPAIEAVARLLVDTLAADGLNLLSSTGAVAGQEVFHFHVHVVPRYADDPGLDKMIIHQPVSDGELDAVYRQILGSR
jgi:histidine triad (HIT) family protein